MKIAHFGARFDTIPQISFFSTQTFLEFDALIININSIASSSPHETIDLIKKRRRDLEEFLSFKKIPIIYLAPNTNIITAHKGNGFARIPIEEVLPVNKFDLTEQAGNDFQINPKTPLTTFLKKYKSYFKYSHYYSSYNGTPIATTFFTDKTLAFYDQNYIFLPPIVNFDTTKEKEFITDLIEGAKAITFDPKLNPLPKWIESYYLPEELEIENKISDLRKKISDLESEVNTANIKLEKLIEKKRLITSTGNELEFYSEMIFKELGFNILEANKNRDDLIIKFKDKVAVVEIKGLTNSAGEKNAAQLEKWKSEYFETNGIEPKGILLINTYRDTPLEDRNQPDFPDQMLRYSINREHCLITTLQLLLIYYEVLKTPESKEEIIGSLFNTIGKYTYKQNWKEYIKKIDS